MTKAKAVYAVAIGLAVSVTLVCATSYELRAESERWTPYTIVLTETSTNDVTANSLQNFVVVARRTDGSRVELNSSDPDHRVLSGTRSIVFASDRKRIDVHDDVKMISTYYLDSVDRPPSDPNCGLSQLAPIAKPELIAHTSVFGFRTVEIRTQTSPFVTLDWKAPDLSCETIRMSEYQRAEDGTRTGLRFEMTTTEVKRAVDPDPMLFAIPQDYAEKLPSEIMQAMAGLNHYEIPESIRRTYQTRDQQYLENHMTKGKRVR